MKEITQIIQAYAAAGAQHKKAVLATVVHIEGSSYRGPGARMLITQDGMLTGAISGGCLEGDVLRKALLVMVEEKPLLITYDTSGDDDAVIGVTLGCNGIIRILLEPVPAGGENNAVSLLQAAAAQRRPAVIATFFCMEGPKDPQQGTRLVYTGDGLLKGDTTASPAAGKILSDVQQVLVAGASGFIQYEQGVTCFLEYLAPAPALIIAGAGNDVLPLAGMAGILGWEVTILDGRPAYANEARFPSCQVMVTPAEDALHKVRPDQWTAVVLMSHNYTYDKALLKQAVTSPAAYIGILGPQKKRERLLQELREEGLHLSAAQLDRVSGPTGLDLGAETPEEIALSILAEIKATFAGASARPLKNSGGHIHRRQTRAAQPMQTYAVLVLAAGASQRLGTPKQELRYQGDTLLRNAVHTAAQLNTAAAVVVLGHDAERLKSQLDGLAAEVVVNDEHKDGMASSIRAGVAYISKQHPGVANVLIMLCDQPHVDALHLRRLIAAQQAAAAPAAGSCYTERKGVPAVFHRSLFSRLEALEGDAGAKHLIESLGDAVAGVPFPEGAIDIDTIEHFQQLTSAPT